MDGPYSQGYDYDVWGNVTHKYGWGGEVQGGTAGQSSDIWYGYTNNRRNGLSYDASGNLTNDIGQAFTYDATGQQTASSYTNLQNYYDGDGLRVKRTEDGLTPTLYLRSSVLGGQVVAEIVWASVSWQWNRGYVYLGSQLLAVQQNGVYWMHEDPVTKSKRVTNSAGTVVSTVELDPWGADTPRSSNGAFQPKKFTSYERDANGSDEAMFRRYNRWHSRFDQPDPYDGSYDPSNPQSFNRYAYTQGDPVNFVDPSGLDKSGISPDPGGKIIGPPPSTVIIPISFNEPISFVGFGGEPIVLHKTPISEYERTGPEKTVPEPQGKYQTPIWCQPDVIKAMGRAWAGTQNGISGNEAGFVLNGTPSNYSIVDTKSANTQSTQKMEIYTNTFLLFRVHPNRSTRNPSTPGNNALGRRDAGDTYISDMYQGQGQTIMFLVGHRTGLTMYDPRAKTVTVLRDNLDWTEKCK